MKKIGYLLILAILPIIGCSSTSGDKSAVSGEKQSVASAVDDQPSSGTAKPEHLTKETFKEKVMDYDKNPRQWVFEGDKPAIVDFYADWCRPCRMIAPIMDELAIEYEGKLNFYKVDTERERELASVFGITSLPTVLFIPATGNPSAQRGAMSKEAYKQIIDEFLLNVKTTN